MAAVENPLGTCVCVCVCVSVPECLQQFLRDDVINGDQRKGQEIFHSERCHTDSSSDSTLSFFPLSSFNEYAVVTCEHMCAINS